MKYFITTLIYFNQFPTLDKGKQRKLIVQLRNSIWAINPHSRLYLNSASLCMMFKFLYMLYRISEI